ncbi:hypothetical protein CORC01_07812 [Colletotrichum orchidophilum]|uniref:Uncharacterized protein n=1 Tax=Colletotrichum orchidophilum TaxID=1209926 RepID=A0A1G4B6D4_9PEZI|nr:uncharacterized protein CORC01_07812 [Colletotrichum orchidophilum]OHE96845.1 hypothetical protein CORC01_07812 [Colletotrichum orchidophilum]
MKAVSILIPFLATSASSLPTVLPPSAGGVAVVEENNKGPEYSRNENDRRQIEIICPGYRGCNRKGSVGDAPKIEREIEHGALIEGSDITASSILQ